MDHVRLPLSSIFFCPPHLLPFFTWDMPGLCVPVFQNLLNYGLLFSIHLTSGCLVCDSNALNTLFEIFKPLLNVDLVFVVEIKYSFCNTSVSYSKSVAVDLKHKTKSPTGKPFTLRRIRTHPLEANTPTATLLRLLSVNSSSFTSLCRH